MCYLDFKSKYKQIGVTNRFRHLIMSAQIGKQMEEKTEPIV